MPTKGNVFTHDISDSVNIQLWRSGCEIFRIRAAVDYIACEKADDGLFIVYGEYVFFLIFRNAGKRNDFSIRVLRSPFVKTILPDAKLKACENTDVHVSLAGNPECVFENADSAGCNGRYRITLSYKVLFCETEGKSASSESKPASEGEFIQDFSGSGSVRVWKIDGSKNHTIEELLGIDRDTPAQFNNKDVHE